MARFGKYFGLEAYYGIGEGMRPDPDAIKRKREAWESDPRHWTNNKRRMHGLPAMRRPYNHRRRTIVPFELDADAVKALCDLIDTLRRDGDYEGRD